jgi:hypothetical protein
MVVQTEIATGKDTSAFFRELIGSSRLVSLIDFENREAIFDIHRSYRFCLLTLGLTGEAPRFGFSLTNPVQMLDDERIFNLSAEDIQRMNPNTGTASVIATKGDAIILRKLYSAAPILIQGEHSAERPSFRLDIVLNQFSSSNEEDSKTFVRVIDRQETVRLLFQLFGAH